jgi:hypothetical protein
MKAEITTNHLRLQSKLDSLITEKNNSDINKIKKKCESVYNNVLKYVENGLIKKTEIECFNWFEIFVKIIECEPDAHLSNLTIKGESRKEKKKNGTFSKSPKDYIITQGDKRIYKIISKSIDYINKTVDCDYDPNYCILDYIDGFIDDAKNMEHFPYKENITELCMIFVEKPCYELIDELNKKNVIPLSLHDMQENNFKPVKNAEYINIDINVIIALCSDINYLNPDSEYISKIIKNKVFIGFNVDETKNLTNEEYCEFVRKEKDFLIDEIKKYKRAIMCESAYNDVVKILHVNGTETEKGRLCDIIKDLEIEIIDEKKYTSELIENNSKNVVKIYNKVERDVVKVGYVLNALTLTSNHRYINFLISKNIFVEAKITTSLNLICQIDKKSNKIF